jgi:hypothetical protein
MRRLAAHYGRFRREYPEDQLLIVFDIDGTILDMRHMVCHVLLSFDRSHGSDWFHGLTADDVTVHENQVDQLLRDMALPAPVAERAYLGTSSSAGSPMLSLPPLARTRACST